MSDTILANATLVLPDEVIKGSLRLSGGLITAIDAGGYVPAGAEDCCGDLVMPGLIELHTDNLERHIEPRPKVQFPHVGAILAHRSGHRTIAFAGPARRPAGIARARHRHRIDAAGHRSGACSRL